MSEIYHAPPQATVRVADAPVSECQHVQDGMGWVAYAGGLVAHGGRRS
jgi:hypothetical protein